ncbi:hypothetical protein OS493_020414 [Desmophyllum pertusum]|uniref:Uncharacterized protein n=1 Tax=Desmophyllum pertusum TaxID=174260 RepID=A0A9W9ZC81_9CNID|nr:hypothetical protein OS493_020414 [Desmophyllum pertusum]
MSEADCTALLQMMNQQNLSDSVVCESESVPVKTVPLTVMTTAEEESVSVQTGFKEAKKGRGRGQKKKDDEKPVLVKSKRQAAQDATLKIAFPQDRQLKVGAFSGEEKEHQKSLNENASRAADATKGCETVTCCLRIVNFQKESQLFVDGPEWGAESSLENIKWLYHIQKSMALGLKNV